MATTAEEELEYESDPEEVKRSFSMRRRKATSDDEEAGSKEEDDNAELKMDRTVVIHSDESDSQGGAAEDYDEEEESDYEDEVYEEEEIDEEEVLGSVNRTEGLAKEPIEVNGNKNVDEGLNCKKDNDDDGEEVEQEEKKENEPFAVSTAGAFYMHDDRFRENIADRNRRTRGGRRLWETKDERKWGHDKFDEMTLQEKHHEEAWEAFRENFASQFR